MDAKRRLVVPLSLGAAKPGDDFEVTFDEDEGVLVFRRVITTQDWLDVLAECPVPIDDL
jgi:hypothetical protein